MGGIHAGPTTISARSVASAPGDASPHLGAVGARRTRPIRDGPTVRGLRRRRRVFEPARPAAGCGAARRRRRRAEARGHARGARPGGTAGRLRRTSDTAARRTRGASRSNPEAPVPIVRSSGTPRDRPRAARSTWAWPATGAARDAPGVWPVTREWSRATENLYSAWIEKLFDDPLDAEPSLARPPRGHARSRAQPPPRPPRSRRGRRARAPARARLRRPAVLPARLLRVEARAAVRLLRVQPRRRRPAAALRALALEPRGRARCAARRVERMQQFLARDVADAVQSGAGRAPGEDDRTDFYPTRLSPGDAPPGHRLRRSVRAHARRRAPGAADGHRRRPAPRGRRAARRDRRAQALLARQLPLRARPDARQRRASSTSGRSCARTTGCGRSTTTRSTRPGLRRLRPRAVRARGRGLLRSRRRACSRRGPWTRRACCTRRSTRSTSRCARGSARSRTARNTWRSTPRYDRRCRRAPPSSRPRVRGRTTRPRRAICAS